MRPQKLMKTMKFTKLINLFTLGAALIVAGAGCRHTPQNPIDLEGIKKTTTIGNPQQRPEALPPGGRFPGGDNNNGSFPNGVDAGRLALGPGHEGWAEHPDVLSAQTIHFDYDKSAIKAGERSKLDAVAAYLKSHPNDAVRVDGHCDERGTEEYNRSLGERRALSAREYIVSQGIDPTRVDTQTFGKDKPVAFGHDEGSWAQNRRDEFVVLTAPGR